MHVFPKAIVALALLIGISWPGGFRAQEKNPVPAMEEWAKDVRKRIEKSEKLKKLAADHPLVVLYLILCTLSALSGRPLFTVSVQTADPKKYLGDPQLVVGRSKALEASKPTYGGQQNLGCGCLGEMWIVNELRSEKDQHYLTGADTTFDAVRGTVDW